MNRLNNNSFVSIGMPVYNGEAYIKQAIDSLLAQTHEELELIICDNASIDGTQKICLQYASQDKRIQYHYNEVNIGAIKNFEKTLELAKYDYFMWAAHDDIWETEYVSILVNLLNNDQDVVLAFSMFNAIDDFNKEIVQYPHIFEIPSNDIYQRLSNYINQFEGLGKANPIYGLMRKEYTKQAFSDTMIFMENNIFASDMLFVFQLLTLGKIAIDSKTLFHKRIISSLPSPNVKEIWGAYLDGYQYLIRKSTRLNNSQKRKLIQEVWIRRVSRRIQFYKGKVSIKKLTRKIKQLIDFYLG